MSSPHMASGSGGFLCSPLGGASPTCALGLEGMRGHPSVLAWLSLGAPCPWDGRSHPKPCNSVLPPALGTPSAFAHLGRGRRARAAPSLLERFYFSVFTDFIKKNKQQIPALPFPLPWHCPPRALPWGWGPLLAMGTPLQSGVPGGAAGRGPSVHTDTPRPPRFLLQRAEPSRGCPHPRAAPRGRREQPPPAWAPQHCPGPPAPRASTVVFGVQGLALP